MVYPISVHKQSTKAGKVTQSDMMRFWHDPFLLCCLLGYSSSWQWILKVYLGASMAGALLITLLIAAIIGSVLLRYFVFDEPTRVQEYENQSNDSLQNMLLRAKTLLLIPLTYMGKNASVLNLPMGRRYACCNSVRE